MLRIILAIMQSEPLVSSMQRVWKANEPTYQSTWIEIEELLYEAEIEMNSQRAKFHIRKSQGSKEGKYRAVMKYQRAKGIVDTLRWILGERGQKSPLEERLGELNYLMR